MSRLYYISPSQEAFDDVKQHSMDLWREIDSDNDKFGYASSKINRIKDIKNVGDNFMYMVAMFDIHNQQKLADKLRKGTRDAIRERMIDGGNPEYLIVF